MTSVTFLLKDDPFAVDAGDTRISRLLMEIAADAFEVRAIALRREGESAGDDALPMTRVPSPRRAPVRGRAPTPSARWPTCGGAC